MFNKTLNNTVPSIIVQRGSRIVYGVGAPVQPLRMGIHFNKICVLVHIQKRQIPTFPKQENDVVGENWYFGYNFVPSSCTQKCHRCVPNPTARYQKYITPQPDIKSIR